MRRGEFIRNGWALAMPAPKGLHVEIGWSAIDDGRPLSLNSCIANLGFDAKLTPFAQAA
jgi:hypothetical protein